MSARRIPIVATLVVLAAVATMVMLGFWQLDRKEQKEELLARYAAAVADPAPLPSLPADPVAYLYRRTTFTCSQVLGWRAIAGRSAGGAAGYVQVASCPEGQVVVGWSNTLSFPRWSGGSLAGTIAPGGEAGWRVVADPPFPGFEANARPDPNDIPNNHLAYAGQWFFFALTALLIFALAVRKRSAK